MALEKTKYEEKTYPLPLEITLTFPIGLIILFLVMGPLFLAFPFIIPFNEMDGSPIFRILMFYIFMPLLGLGFLIIPIFQNILKKNRIIIDDECIRVNSIFKNTLVFWGDVLDITTFTLNHNEFLGFVTKDKVEKLNNGGFGASFNASMGGIYGAAIPLKQIGKLDREKVVYTIKNIHGRILEGRIAENEAQISLDNENRLTENKDEKAITNYQKALLNSFIAASLVGLVYSVSILLLQINFMILPIVGVMAIFHYFGKNILAKDYNTYCRLWVALLGVYSIYVARIMMIFILGKIFPTPVNIISILNEYFFIYLPENIAKEIVWLLTSGITIVLGYLQGPSFMIFQKLNSLFMRRLGRIPYENDDVYYTLYFILPNKFDENTDKYQLEVNFGCEIEIESKKPTYFKIPLSILNESKIKWPHEYFKKSMDGQYLEIDMGGVGNTKEYVYSAFIVCNNDKEIEQVKIEVH